MCVFFIIVCLFTIVLSLLRNTDSDYYPFGMFKICSGTNENKYNQNCMEHTSINSRQVFNKIRTQYLFFPS